MLTWGTERHTCSHQHPLMPVLWFLIHHYTVNTVSLNVDRPADQTKPIKFWKETCLICETAKAFTWSCWLCSCCESWPCVGCWDHELQPARKERIFFVRVTLFLLEISYSFNGPINLLLCITNSILSVINCFCSLFENCFGLNMYKSVKVKQFALERLHKEKFDPSSTCKK